MNSFSREKVKQVGGLGFDNRTETEPARKASEGEMTYMYVPPFHPLLQAIGTTKSAFENSTEISIPTELFKLLLQVAIANSDFNETGYLASNPDVAAAVRSGMTKDAQLQTYTDVAEGVRTGQIESASEHFRVAGVAEGRSPNARYNLAAQQWKKAIARV